MQQTITVKRSLLMQIEILKMKNFKGSKIDPKQTLSIFWELVYPKKNIPHLM